MFVLYPPHSCRAARSFKTANGGRGDARADQRSHVGLRHLRREYAGQYASFGEVKGGGVSPCRANRKKRPLRSAPKACVLQGTTLFLFGCACAFPAGLAARRGSACAFPTGLAVCRGRLRRWRTGGVSAPSSTQAYRSRRGWQRQSRGSDAR